MTGAGIGDASGFNVRAIPVLEIGGTHVAGGVIDQHRWTVVRRTSSRSIDSGATGDRIVGDFARCGGSLDVASGSHWGIAIPGPFDYVAGVGKFVGVAKFGALNGVDVGAALRGSLRAARVTFINDAAALLLGEWLVGAARGHERAMAITLGTGIGSSFLADGEIVSGGSLVPPDGHVHRLPFRGRPLEDFVSRRAIRRRYAEALGLDPAIAPDVLSIADLARDGDPRARRVFAETMSDLAGVLTPWIARFAPTVVVVGGGIAGSWDLIGQDLLAGLDSHRQLSVRRSEEPDAALIGAAWEVAAACRAAE